jgi:hypothetical protein
MGDDSVRQRFDARRASGNHQERIIAQIPCCKRTHRIERGRERLGLREPKGDEPLARLKVGGQTVAGHP